MVMVITIMIMIIVTILLLITILIMERGGERDRCNELSLFPATFVIAPSGELTSIHPCLLSPSLTNLAKLYNGDDNDDNDFFLNR